MTAVKPAAVCRQWNIGEPLLDLIINRRGDWVMGALGNGQVVLLPADDAGEDPIYMDVHEGVSLEIARDSDDHAFLSGGDDGRVFLIEPSVAAPTLLAEHKGKWIDHVAATSGGHRAYASGKTLYRLNEEGLEAAPPLVLDSTIAGLAFSPNGKRLAVSHYNGVSLFWTNAPQTPAELLPWKGAHQNMYWTPDDAILLSSMQDNALHGWKLGVGLAACEPGNEMHMQGYEAKILSMGFTADKKYLTTSGAAQIICWPFFDGGPWNKEPTMLGGAEARLVTRVAPHPNDPLVAAGYDDGMVVLAPFDGRMEIMIHPPVAAQDAGIVGMAWNNEGDSLMVAWANGWIRLFTLASISRFVRGRFGN